MSTEQPESIESNAAYPSQEEALAKFQSLQERAKAELASIVQETQTLLDKLAGVRYESLAENQQLVSKITELMHQLGYRVREVSDPNQPPSILRCFQDGRGKKTGRFQFEYPQNGKTKRASSSNTFPHMLIVPPKEDRRLKKW